MEPDRKRLDVVGHMVDDCLAVRVRLLNRVISGLYDEALRRHGVRISQVNILVAVAHLGEARPAEVCRALRIERSTLSRDVELMKREGWLESDPPAGGRNQTLRAMGGGLALLARIGPDWERAQAEARSLIGEDGADALHRVAARLGFRAPC